MSNCYCCVPQCRSRIKRNPELSCHVFPTAGKSKVFVNTEIGGKELVDRRKVWIQQLKMGKRVSNSLRVCSLHFNASDFFLKEKVKRRRLKSNAVPSENLPVGVVPNLSLQSTTRTEIREQVLEPCENTLDFEDVEDRKEAGTLLALMTSHKARLKNQMESQQIEIVSQAQIKIEPELNIKHKQQEEQYLKIEEKLDVTKNSCTVQYTNIETKLFSDNSFVIKEEEIHIKDESEQRLEEVVKNSKNFEEGGVQQCFTNDEEKYNKTSLILSDEKNFKCDVCKKSFSWKSHLKRHLLIHCGHKKFKCNVCEKSFTRKSDLKRHFLFHSGDKNFKCNICVKSFTIKSDLKRHLLIHFGDKNFKCDVCEKSFIRKGDLNQHLLIHSGDKNFKCDVCEKSFFRKSDLNQHLLIHSGDKNFKCDICEKSFTRKSNLNQHLLIHS